MAVLHASDFQRKEIYDPHGARVGAKGHGFPVVADVKLAIQTRVSPEERSHTIGPCLIENILFVFAYF